MNWLDLQGFLDEKRQSIGEQFYKNLSQIFQELKTIHQKEFYERKPQGDHEQSWRAFKGKNFEKIILWLIRKKITQLGLKGIDGNRLERIQNSSVELSQVKRNLVIDYGKYGLHLPNVDIVVYHPKSYAIVFVLSCKITLRERIAQTAYWKIKLSQDKKTKHIPMYLITLEEDQTLIQESKIPNKDIAIVSTELDRCYTMTQNTIPKSKKIQLFESFYEDLEKDLEKYVL